MPTSMIQDNQKYYLHYDQVGTLRLVTDINHNIIKEVTYDTFGNILNDTNTNLQIPFGFAGGLHDRDTNLVHFGYREYDPFTGKWTAKDPIGFDGGDANLYGYVLGNPVSLIDPSGLVVPAYVAYYVIVGGRIAYIGITKAFKARKAAHKKRWPDGYMEPKKKDLCYSDARKYEQGGIDKKGLDNLDNKINGIGKNNKKRYQDYLNNKDKYQKEW